MALRPRARARRHILQSGTLKIVVLPFILLSVAPHWLSPLLRNGDDSISIKKNRGIVAVGAFSLDVAENGENPFRMLAAMKAGPGIEVPDIAKNMLEQERMREVATPPSGGGGDGNAVVENGQGNEPQEEEEEQGQEDKRAAETLAHPQDQKPVKKKVFQEKISPIFNRLAKRPAKQPKELKDFDFDPSASLMFELRSGERQCFYEEMKGKAAQGDGTMALGNFTGAFLVSSREAEIDAEVLSPSNSRVWFRERARDGWFDINSREPGLYSICFENPWKYGKETKRVSFAADTLDRQHGGMKPGESVQPLEDAVLRLGFKMGELESEQRLVDLRTSQQMEVMKQTNSRVIFYAVLETFIYIAILVGQVIYIKYMLRAPTKGLRP